MPARLPTARWPSYTGDGIQTDHMRRETLEETPHRRFNPLTREWLLVSPHRSKRLWRGQVEQPPLDKQPAYNPHCHIGATAEMPNLPEPEQLAQRDYLARPGTCLLCRYLSLETEHLDRIVYMNRGFVALVPYWAVWPFETLVLSRRHVASIAQLDQGETLQLADIMQRLTIRYDNLFQASFPYSIGFHQRPTDRDSYPEWHFHAHYFPPLLRSATIPKFMVGYEMLATPQRDITPEIAAAQLREAGDTHFLERGGRRTLENSSKRGRNQ